MAAANIDQLGTRDTASRAGAIVVLGARVQPDGSASPPLQRRAEHGVALFNQGLAPLLVFSGGIGDNPPSEASVAFKIAEALGVPAGKCVLEEASHSTRENAKLTAALLRERGVTSVIVVSDPYHLYRARWLFEHEGLTVTTSPVIDSPRHQSALSRIGWTLREVASLAKDVALSLF